MVMDMNTENELNDLRRQLTDEILDEGIIRIWSHDTESVNHAGLPWAYTVGRTMNGQPELLVTGLDEETSQALLSELERLDVHPDHPLETAAVGRVAFILAETGMLHAAFAVFGRDFSALQIVWQGNQPLHPVGGLIATDPYPEEW